MCEPSTFSRTRTGTVSVLSAVPLPLGYEGKKALEESNLPGLSSGPIVGCPLSSGPIVGAHPVLAQRAGVRSAPSCIRMISPLALASQDSNLDSLGSEPSALPIWPDANVCRLFGFRLIRPRLAELPDLGTALPVTEYPTTVPTSLPLGKSQVHHLNACEVWSLTSESDRTSNPYEESLCPARQACSRGFSLSVRRWRSAQGGVADLMR